MTALRIIVADDHEVVRRGVKALLETQAGWQVIGEASGGLDAIEKALQLRPDIVVLDVNLPDLDGIEAGRRIRETIPETEVLTLTYFDSPFLVRKALEAGIQGYVLKSDAGRDLLAGVIAVSQHKLFLSSKVSPDIPGDADHESDR
ncbi:MAG: response regulator [Terriglobia bacterium]